MMKKEKNAVGNFQLYIKKVFCIKQNCLCLEEPGQVKVIFFCLFRNPHANPVVLDYTNLKQSDGLFKNIIETGVGVEHEEGPIRPLILSYPLCRLWA